MIPQNLSTYIYYIINKENGRQILKMAVKSFMASIYMNEEFVKEYFEPFLKLAVNDESLDIEVRKMRKKRGREKVTPEIESPAVRALIKKYVEHHKKRLLNKTEKPKEVKNEQTDTTGG